MTETTRVIVVGGGYGGITVAKALDDVADVVLVEPRTAFVHNVAALRAVVDPEWAERIFIPYDGLLKKGTVRRDRAVRVSASTVELAGGAVLTADFVVLATGAVYPFPARLDPADPQRLTVARRELLAASRVLLVGAGPIGLEFAGEIKAAWPDKHVTLIDRGPVLLPGFPDEFRREVLDQLDALGVDLRLGVTDSSSGGYDVRFDCFGTAPVTDYLDRGLAAARGPDGRLAVTPEMRLPGVPNVFAIGDVTAVPELKMARLAGMHAEVVAANVRSLIEGDGGLKTYTPEKDAILLTLGPRGGASYLPDMGVFGAEQTAAIKGSFRLAEYRELLGA